MIDVVKRLQELEEDVRYQEPAVGIQSEWGYKAGRIPILLSAPHAAVHVRDGKVKEEDEFTAALAQLVGERTGAHVLYTRRKLPEDPNWHADAAYKKRLTEIVREAGIRFVLDIHGAVSHTDFGVALGTADGESCPEHFALILDTLEKFGLSPKKEGLDRIDVNDAFPARGSNTITRYVSEKLGVPAVQMEVNAHLRIPRRRQDSSNPQPFQGSPERIENMVNALTALVETLREALGVPAPGEMPPMEGPAETPSVVTGVRPYIPGGRHLEGRIAWVTGSSRGIGRAIAEHLASCGATVVVHGSTPDAVRVFDEAESLEAVARAIGQEHEVETMAIHGDLTDPAEVGRIAAAIRGRFGRIDILVNCAGGDVGAKGLSAPLAGKPERNDAVFISLEDLRTVLDRNLMTCILTCREVAPEMMERRAGRIVNIGSIAGLVGLETAAIYATAKAAVHEYSRCLAVLLRPYNVAVNVVAPGDIVTPRFVASREVDEGRMVEDGTLVRYGRPIEVARAVEFLVADTTTYISGQVIRVDGGTQTWPA